MAKQTNTLPTSADLTAVQSAAASDATAKVSAAQSSAASDATSKANAAKAEAAAAAATSATTAAVSAMNTARQNDTQVNPPRLRASLQASLTLTNVWQTVSFKKTGTYDVDTFPNGGRFDTANNKLIAASGETQDKQYDVEFFYKFTAALVPINDIQLRFMIPAPTPIYFPFPDGDGFVNLGQMVLSPFNSTYKQTLYFNAQVRQYGIHLQLRTASLIALLANRPVLVDAALSLFPR